jgi:hypothetical protein
VSASISTPCARPFRRDLDRHGGLVLVEREVDGDARQRQRVAQRNEVGGALGRRDRGDPRDEQHVALSPSSRADRSSVAGCMRCARRARDAMGHLLRAHVDHVRLPLAVEVGKMRRLDRRRLLFARHVDVGR